MIGDVFAGVLDERVALLGGFLVVVALAGGLVADMEGVFFGENKARLCWKGVLLGEGCWFSLFCLA